MKKILLLPVKNEDWVLGKTLACASLWADHIIVADQQSTDASRSIYKEFPKVQMIENRADGHSSDVRKLLLDAARSYEGENALFSFDADEIPTAEILSDGFWSAVRSLSPGTGLEFWWLNLWKSPQFYRSDHSAQGPSWKHFGFIDDRKAAYDTVGVINDHAPRIPIAAVRNSRKFDFPKVLHYQFANWERTTSKQALYRMKEYLQRKPGYQSAFLINAKYFSTGDERGLHTMPVPEGWLRPYREQGVSLEFSASEGAFWQDREIGGLFEKHGLPFFSALDVWNIDWIKRGVVKQGAVVPPPRPAWWVWVMTHALPVFARSRFIFDVYGHFKSFVQTLRKKI